MKIKYLLGILILSALATTTSVAQAITRFTGTWEGKLDVGVELRIVFHIKENGKGALTATADSPDQGALGLKCDTAIVFSETLTIEMKDLNARFTGKLVNDSVIDGNFTQGAEIPLVLKKVDKPSERKRSQTPQPPFPYKTEEIEYYNKDKSLRFGATITIPSGKGPFPAALLITGSGPQNRDEDIMGHKLFAVLADHLSRNGFVVVRTDDRGVGKSTGKFEGATSADFAQDASAGVEYLQSRPEVNNKKIGLVGHSEGGMIAPMVATQRKDINFIVLMAAPGIKITELMTEQNIAILRSAGISTEATAAYSALYKKLLEQILNAPDTVAASSIVHKTIKEWADTTRQKLVEELDLHFAEKRNNIATSLAQIMSSPWFKYFLAYDPVVYLERIKCKVLAINGDKDIQVISSSNLAGIEQALKKGKAKNYHVTELAGMNHLFQRCTKCTLDEYGELEETFSPIALGVISDWLSKNVK